MAITHLLFSLIILIWNLVAPVFSRFNYNYWPEKSNKLQISDNILDKNVLKKYNNLANYYNSFQNLDQVNSERYNYIKKFIIFTIK